MCVPIRTSTWRLSPTVPRQILHRDSLGTEQTIEPGAVNWMRAGRGIVHSERTSPDREAQRPAPVRHRPGWHSRRSRRATLPFVHHGSLELPQVEAEGVTARLITGQAFGARSPLETPSETLMRTCSSPEMRCSRSSHLTRSARSTRLRVRLRLRATRSGRGQLLVLRPWRPHCGARRAKPGSCFSAERPWEGRAIWWNFVSSRAERIEQAKEEWARGRFDTVPGDERSSSPAQNTGQAPARNRRRFLPRVIDQ